MYWLFNLRRSVATTELDPDAYDRENDDSIAEVLSPTVSSPVQFETTGGRPGLVTFYSQSNRREEEILISSPRKNQNGLLWFVGPTVLVASFVFPSLYLRRILSAVFEDSLLTGGFIWPCCWLFFDYSLFREKKNYFFDYSLSDKQKRKKVANNER